MFRFITFLGLVGGVTAFVPSQHLALHRVNNLALGMTEPNERARVERNLEEMMGDDWRVFRARLVAMERAEAEEAASSDEKLTKLGRLGGMFTENTSFLFRKKQKQGSSIFDGDTVGGALPDGMVPEDPFVSKEELPILLKPKANVDKNRWAHTIPHIEPGCVLIANEKLGGVFRRSVILVASYSESMGTTGIVINKPMEGNLLKIASETESNVDLSLKLAFNSALVSNGGPVKQDQYNVLHGYGEVEGAHKLAPGVFVGGSEELMNAVRSNRLSPNEALFVKGRATWLPDQLKEEIDQGVWYPAAVSPNFILRYAGAPTSEQDNYHDLWSDILTSMGDEYAQLVESHAGQGDMRMMP